MAGYWPRSFLACLWAETESTTRSPSFALSRGGGGGGGGHSHKVWIGVCREGKGLKP